MKHKLFGILLLFIGYFIIICNAVQVYEDVDESSPQTQFVLSTTIPSSNSTTPNSTAATTETITPTANSIPNGGRALSSNDQTNKSDSLQSQWKPSSMMEEARRPKEEKNDKEKKKEDLTTNKTFVPSPQLSSYYEFQDYNFPDPKFPDAPPYRPVNTYKPSKFEGDSLKSNGSKYSEVSKLPKFYPKFEELTKVKFPDRYEKQREYEFFDRQKNKEFLEKLKSEQKENSPKWRPSLETTTNKAPITKEPSPMPPSTKYEIPSKDRPYPFEFSQSYKEFPKTSPTRASPHFTTGPGYYGYREHWNSRPNAPDFFSWNERPVIHEFVTWKDQPTYQDYRPEYFNWKEKPTSSIDFGSHTKYHPPAPRVSPWRNIGHFLGALVPLGLLISALKPNVIRVDTNATTANRLGSTVPPRLRSSDLKDTDYIPKEISTELAPPGVTDAEPFPRRMRNPLLLNPGAGPVVQTPCQQEALCEMASAGRDDKGDELQKMLWRAVNQTPGDVVTRLGLKNVFEAAKINNCRVFRCDE